MSNQWREEQNRCQREIDRHQNADKSYLDEGVQLLELARNAQRLFAKQEPREKRRLLNFVLSNCTWEDGEVVATFRQPFDILAETTTIAARNGAGNTANSAKVEIWLGREDSNLRMAESKSAALPLGEAPIPFFPGWRPRRLDHNARRDAPLSFAQRLKIFRFTAGFGDLGGFPSRKSSNGI